jgi:hypothetical protein
MRVDRVRPFRPLAVSAALVLAAIGVAACGGSDDEAQSMNITISGSPKNAKIEAPKSAETGLAEIKLDNKTSQEADAQLVRVEGKHSPAEVVKALGGVIEGKPFPDWFFAGGGVSTTAPNATASVTQVLEPGTYYVFNDESQGPPDPKTTPAIEVTGDASDAELPSVGGGEVQAIDYGFKASGLKAGRNEILFENTGGQPHHILASKAIGDATAADAEKFFKTESGKPPVQEKGTQSTAVVEGGQSQVVTLDLEPGKYVLYCFISDRQGGPPHALKGMVDQVEVK